MCKTLKDFYMSYHVIRIPKVGNVSGHRGGGCECRYGMAVVPQAAAAAVIEPGVLNVWGEMAELSIDFAPGKEGHAGEYCAEWVSGETPTVLSLPETVRFPEEPTIEANMRYQLSVVNSIALIAGVSAAAEEPAK